MPSPVSNTNGQASLNAMQADTSVANTNASAAPAGTSTNGASASASSAAQSAGFESGPANGAPVDSGSTMTTEPRAEKAAAKQAADVDFGLLGPQQSAGRS